MDRAEDAVWEYTVYWNNDSLSIFHGELSRKYFAKKKDAKTFAKAKYKECKRRFGSQRTIRPIITKSTTVRKTFREDVEVEYLTVKELKAKTYSDKVILKW